MGDNNNYGSKKGVAWRFSSSSSVKLLLFMVPLILVSGFLALFGTRASTHTNWLWGYQDSSDGSLKTSEKAVHARKIEGAAAATSTEEEKSPPMVGAVGVLHTKEEKAIFDDESNFNHRSSSPPLPVEDISIQEPVILQNETEEDALFSSFLAAPAPSPSESSSSLDLSMKTRRKKELTNLEKLEARLQKTRAAIKDAKHGNQTHDPNFVPLGPMYWNPNVFQRSYLEMEKNFKVFVYEEGEPPVFHNGPCKSIYSMEGTFIHLMEISQFRTKDPDKAHVFFLPFSVVMMVRFVYVHDSHDFGPIRRTVSDYINLVAGKYPYWNRSLGADHFMLACHDWGPEASFSVPRLGKNSIRALCNANTSERFNPIKDVSFPEINLQSGTIAGLIGGPSPSKRPILAFFAGGLHGPIRPIVLEHWQNKDDDIKVYQYLPKGLSYYDMMKKSKFCLCPSGYEVASPRIVEAFYTGCVPVLISEHYVPPFSDVLNWKTFSVEVSVRDIPNLKKILTSISPRQYIRMQRRVLQVRRHFEVNSPPKRFDVFHMILHSIWLRRLNVRINEDDIAITR